MQYSNRVGVACVCRFIACILHNVKLTNVVLDYKPTACVGRDAWRSKGLPVPPSQVAAKGWTAVLRWLRVRRVFARNLQLPS